MPGFQAINEDPEDTSQDSYDNTEELEIEASLRNYQAAIKAQASGTVEEADAAYRELFESTSLFRNHPSDFNREEQFGVQEDGVPIQSDQQEGGSNTLPSLLYLSYKNRGQFRLTTGGAKGDHGLVKQGLDDFAEALDRDADDVDTWRRAARAGRVLGSLRTARFCLEAVVDGDDQGTDDIIGDAGVDIKLADHDLKDLKKELDDVNALAPAVASTTTLPLQWRKQLAHYPDLSEVAPSNLDIEPSEVTISAQRTWAAIGEALLRKLIDQQQGVELVKPKSFVRLDFQQVENSRASVGPSHGNIGKSRSPELTRRRSGITPGRRDTFSVVDTTNLMSPPPLETPVSPRTLTLPSRKRDIESAELPEAAEGGRVRSKRIKARESLAADPRETESKTSDAPAYEARIRDCTQGDQWLYENLTIYATRSGVSGKRSPDPYRELVREQHNRGIGERISLPLGQAFLDFYNMMHKWDDDKSAAMLRDATDLSAEDGHDTLQAFLEHSAAARQNRRATIGPAHLLDTFCDRVNNGWLTVSDALREWLYAVFKTYIDASWLPEFKQTIVDAAVALDGIILAHLEGMLGAAKTQDQLQATATAELAQTLLELHLERYASIVASNSVFDETSRMEQESRMSRWAFIAREAIYICFRHEDSPETSEAGSFLLMRHIWATVLHMQATKEISQDHLLGCFRRLKDELQDVKLSQTLLPNNSVMPELTIAAADREISKIETMGFFRDIFQRQSMPPVDLIEALEPLLERTVGSAEIHQDSANLANGNAEAVESPGSEDEPERSTLDVLSDFLKKASPSLRLILWTRLREAYQAIDYPSKVLSIQLRCIAVVIEGLKSDDFKVKSEEERGIHLLEALRDLREMLDDAWNLTKGRNGQSSLECFDLPHLQDSIRACLDLSLLLYAVCMFDDHSQIGGKGEPTVNPFRSYPSDTFHAPSIKLHNMQAQTLLVLYRLICEVMAIAPEHFLQATIDKADYLRYVHYHFGVRRMCKALESSFLHFVKDELMLYMPELSMTKQAPDCANELAQVLHDLYGIENFAGGKHSPTHGCDVDYLDRENAMQLLDYVLDKANTMPAKDFKKVDMGKVVDKINATLDRTGTNKRSEAARRNGEVYRSILQSPILPVSLYRSLRGLVDITAVPLKPSEAVIASKGWFFLKGQLALARYRAQRAMGNPGPEDELRQAIELFLQDLEFSHERWETWYRLAQAYTWLVDEDVMWTADALDAGDEDIFSNQRSAIHAYSLAVAMSVTHAHASPETMSKLAELYSDFATCLYTATREPFSMKAFSFDSFLHKHFWEEENLDEYAGHMYHKLSEQEAWKIAAVLLKRAAALNAKDWTIHYMLSKCYWKLHARSSYRTQSSLRTVQRSLTRAVALLPKRKDAKSEDLIMEPIYKMIVITHKVVLAHQISPEQGAFFIDKHLDMQQQLDTSKRPRFADSPTWSAYILGLLKMLRAADRSRWHHRPVMRAAKLMTHEASSEEEGALVAKEYLAEQHIYSTKTMVLTVWKPDNERPGRHHVYSTRYCAKLIDIMVSTSDLEAMQMLVRRIRRRAIEFFGHIELYTDAMNGHLMIHSRYATTKRGSAEKVFISSVDTEQFKTMSAQIDGWIIKPDNKDQAKFCEVLKEFVELKKLNANLIKLPVLDELIADTYAEIWEHRTPAIENPEAPLPTTEHEGEAGPPARRPEESCNHAMSFQNMLNLDGTVDKLPVTVRQVTPMRSLLPASDKPEQSHPPQSYTPEKRPRMVSRPMIIKRAQETILNKPAPKAPSPVRQASPNGTSTEVNVVIDTAGQREPSQEAQAEDDAPESPPGSVHDSADDESDLSSINGEQDDEATPPPRPGGPAIFGQNAGAVATRASESGDDMDVDTLERSKSV